jgi:hypothetical protein
MAQLDSRSKNVKMDFDNLEIASPTQFTSGAVDFAGGGFTSLSGVTNTNAGTAQVTDALNHIAFQVQTQDDQAYLIEYSITGYCTSGAQVGKALAQVTWSRIRNAAGVITPTFFFSNINNIDAGVTAGQDFAVVGTAVNFYYHGQAGCTYNISWQIRLLKAI